jgi:hypothetical protein
MLNELRLAVAPTRVRNAETAPDLVHQHCPMRLGRKRTMRADRLKLARSWRRRAGGWKFKGHGYV